jgi:hypothetical protein
MVKERPPSLQLHYSLFVMARLDRAIHLRFAGWKMDHPVKPGDDE